MYKTKNLLSVGKDAKTVKGGKKGVLTGILYLAPHNVSGYQVCPKASEGCRQACLYTAGQGRYSNVQKARISKTVWFFQERDTFMERLVENIEKMLRKAKRMRLQPAIRLNGTSDIAWEKIACKRNGKVYRNIMEAFSKVQFYCYTKIPNRKFALTVSNYHLTFSLSETNDNEALHAINNGFNVAVVMNVKAHEPKPITWGGYPVIDGDADDIRFKDSKNGGYVIALSAKGLARYDKSGFVRDKNSGFVQQDMRKYGT